MHHTPLLISWLVGCRGRELGHLPHTPFSQLPENGTASPHQMANGLANGNGNGHAIQHKSPSRCAAQAGPAACTSQPLDLSAADAKILGEQLLKPAWARELPDNAVQADSCECASEPALDLPAVQGLPAHHAHGQQSSFQTTLG